MAPRGWTHKSSNGSSLPGGHSSKRDHQEDDDGTDTAEEVLGSREVVSEGRGIHLEVSQANLVT